MGALLQVCDAVVEFADGVRALDGVSLDLDQGEVLAVVGESGCGKTTLARAVLGLQPLAAGGILRGGKPVLEPQPGIASEVGMVWQDPFASLDPRWPIQRSIEEPARLAGQALDAQALAEIAESVGLDERLLFRFPHQLSGGQRQRAAIARALALKPALLICDEPTAALDLSIQAQILNLLRDLQAQTGCAVLYISHDLGSVRFLCDRVAVMYLGRVVEAGPNSAVFERPRHPYTADLLASAPSLDRLGHLPEPPRGEQTDRPRGDACAYAPRCAYARDDCWASAPSPTEVDGVVLRCKHPLGLNSEG